MRSFNLIISLAAFLLIIAAFSNTSFSQNGGEKNMLKFNSEGKFKIAQFTDVHWNNDKKDECDKTIQSFLAVVKNEKPDLIILTGDIVVEKAEDGWKSIASVFSGTNTPWTVTLGNHDDEAEWTREEIFNFLVTQKGFIGSEGEKELTGVGNYILEIKSADEKKTSALIYCFDSNGYPKNKKYGSYDWIHFDQIEWYRKNSKEYTKSNNGQPIPALAYFHIPLLEFNDVWGKETTLGEKGEDVYAPEINSGLFSSFLEMQDVIGIFVGHDHDNNYIGITKEIATAYGLVSGYSAYGKFDRGGRIVEISEGEFAFNTWMRSYDKTFNHYNYPSGLTFDESNIEFFKAVDKNNLFQGINYKYYEGNFLTTDEMISGKPLNEGIMKNISIEDAKVKDHFGYEFSGYIKIPHKGQYKFYTFSDDGTKLFIGDEEVIDNDGSHSPKRAEGIIALEEGYHKFRLLYFEDHAGNVLEIGFNSIKNREMKLPPEMLFIEK